MYQTRLTVAAVATALLLLAPPHAHAQASGGGVSICHLSGQGGRILTIGGPALGGHLAHGDYVATLVVDASRAGDGVHFESISAALAAARDSRLEHDEGTQAACRITIEVPGGTYEGTASAPADGTLEHFPFNVDVPDITLHGAMVMEMDTDGRATGIGAGGVESTLTPTEPLPVLNGSSTPLIVVNAHPGGSAGNGLVVEGFVFQSGHDAAVDAGGQGVLALRVSGLVVRGNRFEGGFTESVDLRGTNGEVAQNHLSGTAGTCDICLAAPGRYRAYGNRLLAGGIPGITVDGVVGLPVPAGIEPFELPAQADVVAEIENNEIRDHLRLPVGVGIRVDALGVGGPNVHNHVYASIHGNRVVNSRFGIIVHAAFPVAGTDRMSHADVSLGGNVFEQICQARLLVSLSRHTTALGLTNNPYLLNSTFRIDLGGDLPWDAAWFSHPAGFGNTLVVDGQTVPNGARQFYDANGCPAN